jgi:hypothetical protein
MLNSNIFPRLRFNNHYFFTFFMGKLFKITIADIHRTAKLLHRSCWFVLVSPGQGYVGNKLIFR